MRDFQVAKNAGGLQISMSNAVEHVLKPGLVFVFHLVHDNNLLAHGVDGQCNSSQGVSSIPVMEVKLEAGQWKISHSK